MQKQRLEALAEGIFAIVMTLLVIEIKVPELHHPTNSMLWSELQHLTPLFLSYILSFVVLATFWRAHVFMISYYAEEIDVHIVNLNTLFFILVALIPFSAHFLGLYHETQIAIALYGLNVTSIALTLYGLRTYMRLSGKINKAHFYTEDRRYSRIRIILPIVASILAIPISFWDTTISLFIYTFVVFFNFIPGGIVLIERVLGMKSKN